MANKQTSAQLFSLPKKVCEMNVMISEKRNDARKSYLQSSCFRGLLFVHNITVKKDAISSLIQHWNIEKQCFMLLDGRELSISDAHVARVYGFPVGGEKLPIRLDFPEREYSAVRGMIRKINPALEGKGVLHFNVVKNILKKKELGREGREVDFFRFYVLYALHRLLVPSSSPFVSVKYLAFLENANIAAGYNWAALVKDKLIESLNSYKEKLITGKVPSARIQGDMHCLFVSEFCCGCTCSWYFFF